MYFAIVAANKEMYTYIPPYGKLNSFTFTNAVFKIQSTDTKLVYLRTIVLGVSS